MPQKQLAREEEERRRAMEEEAAIEAEKRREKIEQVFESDLFDSTFLFRLILMLLFSCVSRLESRTGWPVLKRRGRRARRKSSV